MKRLFCRSIAALAVSIVASRGANAVVNLSHYDEMTPDFVRMTREGVVAAIHEATYPRNVRDERYAARQTAAARAGLLWGAYHFADGTDPVRQADFFCDAVASAWRRSPSRPPGVLMVLDFEKNGHYPGGTMTPHQAAVFVRRIHERTGEYPGLYASEYRIRDVINNAAHSSVHHELAKCWLWVANYHHRPRSTAPWNGWTLWQYCGDGICDLPRAMFPTSVANVRKAERNLFNGSAAGLKSFWSAKSWVPGQ